MLMHSPTVGTFAGFIVGPTDVLTMDIHIPTEGTGDIILTHMEDMEDIILTHTGYIIVHFSGDGLITNAIVGTRQAQKVEHSVPAAG